MSQRAILLVDDEPEIVEQFERALKREGYEVDTAFSGEEGWEKYQSRYYDVVLVDWRMGKMSGLDLLHKIDQTHPPSAKVIMITAYGDESTPIDAHHYHAFDYLKKPVDIDVLVNTVGEAIHRRDGVIDAIEDWVATHPEEASRPFKGTLSGQVWSAKEILEEIKNNTERGRQEYRMLLQLTIDLLTRGKIG